MLVDLAHGHDIRFLPIPKPPVYGILAAPPCTNLAASGARWWKAKGVDALADALAIADACLSKVVNAVEWCGIKINLIVDLKHEVVPAYDVTDIKGVDGETLPNANASLGRHCVGLTAGPGP
jgi:hypothetical protein